MVLLQYNLQEKLYNMYISVFRWGQGCHEIIFRRQEQKPLRVIIEKNRAQWHHNGGILAAKTDVLLA